MRKKTKCPTEQHGDDGLQYGPDFEVLYWSTCTSGHCIFRWKSRGKYHLFTSHAIYAHDDKWQLQCNERRLDDLRPQLNALSASRVDYVFPGSSAADDRGYYKLNAEARRSLATAMKAVA